MMRVVSRDVIEQLSQTRVISSERRYPSVGDIPNRCGTRTNPVQKVPSRDGYPEGDSPSVIQQDSASAIATAGTL